MLLAKASFSQEEAITRGWQWSACQLSPPVSMPTSRIMEMQIIDNRMLEIYADFTDIATSEDKLVFTKARFDALFLYAESHGLTGSAALHNLQQLANQLHWELLDTRRFSLFYRFVFFMSRDKGQKSISISAAVEAWKLALNGRFRLLDHWCIFVQAHHRYAISEDTWRQVLDFSRSVHEDLSNYDPEGAWPVLIDEFVDYMYRKATCCCIGDECRCQSKFPEHSIFGANSSTAASILPGMTASAGSKRRRKDGNDEVALSRHLKRLLLEKPLVMSAGFTRRDFMF